MVLLIRKITKKHVFYIFLLFIITIITHYYWFNLSAVLSFEDWSHYSDLAAQQLAQNQRVWSDYFSLGQINALITSYPIFLLISFLVNIGLSYDAATKLLIFLPVAILGFISPYLLFDRFRDNKLISFITALYYGSTSYFLIKESNHILLAGGYALAPLVLYFWLHALEKNNLKSWLYFVCILTISIVYEIRVTFITFIILLIYFLFFYSFKIRRYIIKILLSGILFLLLNSYWLLPVFFSSYNQAITSITNRSLWGNTLFDMSQSITLHESSWTGISPNWSFIKQPIAFYFWFIPMLALIPLIFLRRFNDREKKYILFFQIIALIGILLTKQSAHPFPLLYQWLYDHLPGFNLFREASKLYQLTAFGYAGLLVYCLALIWRCKKKSIFIFTAFLIFAAIFLNLKPLINREIGALFIPRTIPDDYRIIQNELNEDKEYYRSILVPSLSRWFPETATHPVIDTSDIIYNQWKDFIQLSEQSNNLSNEDIVQIFKKPYSKKLFESESIRFFFIPGPGGGDEDGIFATPGRYRDFFVREMDKLSYLRKINFGTKYISVYEDKNYKPHLYMTDGPESFDKNIPWQKIIYRQINSGQYHVYLNNIRGPFYLNFTESYNADWKIRNLKGNLLPDRYHSKNIAQVNSFYIDPRLICRLKQGCELILFFKPEFYFQVGLIVTCLSFIIVVLFFLILK